jgi:hypothetical protein
MKLGYPLVFHIHLIKKIKHQWKNLLPYIQVWHCTANCNNAILLKIVNFYMCTIKPAKNFVSGILTMEKRTPHVEVQSVCLLSTMEPFNTPPPPNSALETFSQIYELFHVHHFYSEFGEIWCEICVSH